MLFVSLSGRVDADPRGEARELFQSASLHYNLREYKEALADFTKAYRVHHDPTFLFNIAQCHRLLHDPVSAASFYRNYRREKPNAPNRDEVERLIVEMDQEAAAQKEAAAAAERQRAAEAEAERLHATQAAAAASTSSPALVASAPPKKPITKKPWFWAVVGVGAAAVVTGVALAVVFGRPQDPTPSLGRVDGP